MAWSLTLPPSKAVTVFGTEELPIAVDMRGRLKDTNEDISEVTVTVKDAGGVAVSGGMFVFRDALVEAAETAGMLVDLTSDDFSSLDADGLAALRWQRRLTVIINIMGRLGLMERLRQAFVI